MSHEDIRARLAAVEGLDWSKVEREYDAEYFTDWIHVGPVQIMTTFSPGPADVADVERTEAVAAFLQHAVADIRRLLNERDGRP